MTSLLADGKPHFVYIDEETKKMWWIMPDMETVRKMLEMAAAEVEEQEVPPEEA